MNREEKLAYSAAATRRWRERNPEKVKEINRTYWREYKEKNPEKVAKMKKDWYENNKAHFLDTKRAWAHANADKVRAYQRAYTKKNKEKVNRWQRECYARNPGPAKAAAVRRKRKIRDMNLGLSKGLITRLIVSQLGLCCSCKADISVTGYHLDHIKPLSKGGLHEDSNIQLMCPTCNKSKGNSDNPRMSL